MLNWLILVVLVVAGMLLLARFRRRVPPPPPASSDRPPTVPVEVAPTIRSYVLPKRWLGGDRAKSHADTPVAELARYSSATVERVAEGGGRGAHWDLLRGRTRLGRDSDNHVVLDDERVSLHHALITVR